MSPDNPYRLSVYVVLVLAGMLGAASDAVLNQTPLGHRANNSRRHRRTLGKGIVGTKPVAQPHESNGSSRLKHPRPNNSLSQWLKWPR